MSSKRARSTGRRDDAVARIRRLVEHGELASGMRLPGERQLADRLKMSRGTVREALQFLGAMGLVATRRGCGAAIRPAPLRPRGSISGAFATTSSPIS
jgi:DNA-binding FadR family transcriptional regulator